jgi:hypothetical protein
MKKKRLNCWEYMKCGREPGGDRIDELGACPVPSCDSCHGINRGVHAGRLCWAIAGTLCNGEIQGTFARKLMTCQKCPFYLLVEEEEGRDLILARKEHL